MNSVYVPVDNYEMKDRISIPLCKFTNIGTQSVQELFILW